MRQLVLTPFLVLLLAQSTPVFADVAYDSGGNGSGNDDGGDDDEDEDEDEDDNGCATASPVTGLSLVLGGALLLGLRRDD